jgi:putative Mg2+ transporter-C (MgtC) family protein
MSYLVEDWWRLFSAPAAGIALALVAVGCGTVVGWERERREKPAGLRTLTLVCLGSAVFTMMSSAMATERGDAGRIAAQIVTGIGFLGGGIILREPVGVTGATTAASIWTIAAIGMVAGAGRGGAAIALTLLMRTTLIVLHAVEEWRISRLPATIVTLVFAADHGKTRMHIEKLLVQFDPGHEMLDAAPGADPELRVLRVRVRMPKRHARELLAELAAVPQVREIDEQPLA